jgi:hypothetical protein
MESRCTRCKGTLYQCAECRDTDRALAKSLKEAKRRATQPISAEALKQFQFRESLGKQFIVKEMGRDGNCAFESISCGMLLLKEKYSQKQLRRMVSKCLIENNGVVGGEPYAFFNEESDGFGPNRKQNSTSS